MATHDYVIANGTGAAVRADLNNALAAIVSNNSGSSAPGTTYAYQWWADTNDNVLKIRNSANDGWITLRELDGTMLIEDGSASTPGLAFADDVNTGIFSPAADQIGFATGGAERLEITSSEVVFNDPSNDVDFRVESNGNTHMLFVDAGNNRVGIGTSSPERVLVVSDDGDEGFEFFPGSSDTGNTLNHYDRGSSAFIDITTNADQHIFSRADGEKIRIDSSGRLLIGTSTSEAFNGIGGALQIEGTSDATTRMSLFRTQNDASASVLVFAKARNTSHAVLSDDDEIGKIEFYGADGSDTNQRAGMILCAVDGTPGGNDMPGRLAFFTTADGSATPTERMRLTSNGRLGLGHTSPQFGITINQSSDDTGAIGWEDGSNNKRASIRCNASDDELQFHTGTSDSERMSIQSNGRVNMFHVYSTALSGTMRDVHIESGGQLGYNSSTRDSKENISLLSNVDWLYQLQPSSFNYKKRDKNGEYTDEVSTELEYGLIAEDVEPIAPELCFYDEVEGEMELRGIHYKKLIVPLLKALQDANTKITTLEAKVAALEAG